jgi:hypothetical protein
MKDDLCPAPDARSAPSSSPSGPRSASSTDSLAPHTNIPIGSQVSDLIQAHRQSTLALQQAAVAMTLLSQSIQSLIEYGTRDNDEESDYPTVGLDGRPIPRS